jgi:predicted ferric reductase
MALNRNGLIFLILVLLFSVGVSIFSYIVDYSDPYNLSVRLFALNGFFFLATASMMTPFLKEIRSYFNKSFIDMHHSFAAIGLVLVTLHPLTLFARALNPLIFLPNFSSFNSFWMLAGRQALIVIYIALVAVFLPRKIPKYWKYWKIIHALMYLALLFAIVHGNLIGTDFENSVILLVFNGLFAGVIAAFILKRIQQYRIRSNKKS